MYGSICHFAPLADGLSVNDFKNIFVSLKMITNKLAKKRTWLEIKNWINDLECMYHKAKHNWSQNTNYLVWLKVSADDGNERKKCDSLM